MHGTRLNRQIMVEPEATGGYHVFCPSLPGCHSQGDTLDEALANIREAIELYIEDMRENGETVPEDDLGRVLIVI